MRVVTTFGAIPNGTTFDRMCKEKDPADRRRRIYRSRSFVKQGQGTEAGFATKVDSGNGHRDSVRFSLYDRVTIDTTDLRLLVQIKRVSA